jgi:hypothetical protein
MPPPAQHPLSPARCPLPTADCRLLAPASRLLAPVLTLLLLWAVPPVAAQPSQEEFFRSIGRSLEQNPMLEGQSSVKLMAVIFSIGGLLILLLIKNRPRATVAAPPRPVNHSRKLTREVLRKLPIDAARWRRLQALAEQRSLSNPLLLLLCPSLEGNGDGEPANGTPKTEAGHQEFTSRSEKPGDSPERPW